MRFGGLQKLSLLDFPGKMSCIVFTAGCNFRCPYCHNASLVKSKGEDMDESEILSFLKKRTGILAGVVISGGEPLLHDGIADFCRKVKALGYAVKLDTNGTSPDRLKALVEEGLVDYVAMDIKNSPEKYAYTVGVESIDLSKVKESVEFLLKGTVPYEFRTTVVGPYFEVEDFEKIGKWISGAESYALQRFKDSGDLLDDSEVGEYTEDNMQLFLCTVKKWVPTSTVRG